MTSSGNTEWDCGACLSEYLRKKGRDTNIYRPTTCCNFAGVLFVLNQPGTLNLDFKTAWVLDVENSGLNTISRLDSKLLVLDWFEAEAQVVTA